MIGVSSYPSIRCLYAFLGISYFKNLSMRRAREEQVNTWIT